MRKPLKGVDEYLVKYDINNMNKPYNIIKFNEVVYQADSLKFIFLSYIKDPYTTLMTVKILN